MAAADVAAPTPFLGSWGSMLLISLAVVYALSVVVHLANLVLVPVLLVVPGALAWSLYARWLRPHTSPGFDGRFFKRAMYGFWPTGFISIIAIVASTSPYTLTIGYRGCSGGCPLDFSDASGVPVLLFIGSMIVACVEEVAKVLLLRTPLDSSTVEAGHRAHATVALVVATSLGYATFASVMALLVLYAESYVSSGGYQSVLAGGVALAMVIRLLTYAPLHALCAAVTGLRMVVRSMQRAREVALLVRASTLATVAVESRQRAHESVLDPSVSPTPAAAMSLQPQQPSQDSAAQSSCESVPLQASSKVIAPARIALWSWPRVLGPAMLINAIYSSLDVLIFGNTTAPTIGQTALSLALHTAMLLGCYVAVNHMFLQQWLLLVMGEEPVPVDPLAAFMQLVRSAPGDVLWPFWWRPEFSAAAAQEASCESAAGMAP